MLQGEFSVLTFDVFRLCSHRQTKYFIVFAGVAVLPALLPIPLMLLTIPVASMLLLLPLTTLTLVRFLLFLAATR